MPRILFGLFVVLHGLVHLWYFTLSQRLVEFKPEMGWSGRSWLFTNLLGDATTRMLAGVVYLAATIAFVVSGIGLFTGSDWWRPVLVGAAVFSAAIILVLWDGGRQLIVQKGLLGLLIDLGILAALCCSNDPRLDFRCCSVHIAKDKGKELLCLRWIRLCKIFSLRKRLQSSAFQITRDGLQPGLPQIQRDGLRSLRGQPTPDGL